MRRQLPLGDFRSTRMWLTKNSERFTNSLACVIPCCKTEVKVCKTVPQTSSSQTKRNPMQNILETGSKNLTAKQIEFLQLVF